MSVLAVLVSIPPAKLKESKELREVFDYLLSIYEKEKEPAPKNKGADSHN